jgi:hypothetical protein
MAGVKVEKEFLVAVTPLKKNGTPFEQKIKAIDESEAIRKVFEAKGIKETTAYNYRVTLTGK